jgi:hypothetical protein
MHLYLRSAALGPSRFERPSHTRRHLQTSRRRSSASSREGDGQRSTGTSIVTDRDVSVLWYRPAKACQKTKQVGYGALKGHQRASEGRTHGYVISAGCTSESKLRDSEYVCVYEGLGEFGDITSRLGLSP